MAERKSLLELTAITDHSCGNYTIGEVEGFTTGYLYDYLRQYGYKGKQEILMGLVNLINRVATTYDEVAKETEPQAQQAMVNKKG